MPADEGWSYYTAKYLPAMRYSLPATYLSRTQCKAIMASSTGAFLHTQHFPQTFSSPMTFGPKTMGGLGFRDLWVDQGCLHLVNVLLAHGRAHTGKLHHTLCITYSWYHQLCGTRLHPYATPHNVPDYAPNGWFLETHHFLDASNISILWQTIPEEHWSFRNDTPIMERVMSTITSKSTKRKINACRISQNTLVAYCQQLEY